MIFVGYQGIGKSTLSINDNRFVDLESSNFFIEGKRADDWYKIYCKIAKNLSEKNNHIFVSSHKVVRDELANYSKNVVLIYPSLELKYTWIQRLLDRYDITKLEKDKKAYLNAVDSYDDSISEMKNDNRFSYIEICDTDYSLDNMILDFLDTIDSINNLKFEFMTEHENLKIGCRLSN